MPPGSSWTVMKVGLQFVDPLNFVAQRFLIASIALLPVLAWKRRNLLMDSYTWFKLIVLSLINAIGITSTSIGLLYETAGLSSLLTYTQPFFVLCLSVIFLDEKVSVIRVAGLIFGFLGVATLYASNLSLKHFSSTLSSSLS
ncbi:MAG: DMT family transporter [Candidatus Bathyarchaeia archaeon]